MPESVIRNRLLEALPESVLARFQPHLEPIGLPIRYALVEPDKRPEHVYFITSGLASVVTSNHDHESIEVGHIGFEGMTGAHLLLHTDTTPASTFIQIEGTGLRMPSNIFLDLVENERSVRELFLRYVHCNELQLNYSALANARYSVNERLARWLLMCHDRMHGGDVVLTHEFLALMLGVRRSGVTVAIHILEGVKAIRARRGNIKITNRAMLLDLAGGIYGVPEAEYDRLIGPLIPRFDGLADRQAENTGARLRTNSD
ncbi:Crp/Fnr family transcriptional regulator [Rhizobium sp. TH2]|uniref:Crp/Fnr family transcriptional regulator n=1 Tax=Rhizobium sp. TH2 TaxID=2775403 RepID=UPI002157E751|nr:Crp/Fnr family transcriptional regulator [Rhizobium sp. TH2]UVC06742.1 Crp/Fnr family transcriptional regulator [Rhizobium sp. TH2]